MAQHFTMDSFDILLKMKMIIILYYDNGRMLRVKEQDLMQDTSSVGH